MVLVYSHREDFDSFSSDNRDLLRIVRRMDRSHLGHRDRSLDIYKIIGTSSLRKGGERQIHHLFLLIFETFLSIIILNKENLSMKRKTLQRKIIYDAVCDLGHSTIQDIVDYCLKESLPISLATIYRNLELLEKEGYVRKIPTIYRFDIYEDASQDDHDHFVCTECQQVYDIAKDSEFVPYKSKDGDLYSREMRVYYGVCRNCLKEKKC